MFYSTLEERKRTVPQASLILQGLVKTAPAMMYEVARDHCNESYDPRHLPVPLEVSRKASIPFDPDTFKEGLF
jgi:hypothetical protein